VQTHEALEQHGFSRAALPNDEVGFPSSKTAEMPSNTTFPLKDFCMFFAVIMQN
jgi:hypothetical protein